MNSRVFARYLTGLLLAFGLLALAGCGERIYVYPKYEFGNRVVPPSGILNRVLATYSSNGDSGGAEILDGLRDIRSNVQDTKMSFFITGFTAAQPTQILNFPSEQIGFVLNQPTGALTTINYATEASSGNAGTYGAYSPSVTVSGNQQLFAGVDTALGQVLISSVVNGVTRSASLNVPNAIEVATNTSGSVVLVMLRNSNSLYRAVQLSQSTSPVIPPGSVDCEPQILPQFCLVPVAGTYDRPTNAYFSLDGSQVYVMNCGPECGGTTAGITVLSTAAVVDTQVPTINPLDPAAVSPMVNLGVPNPIPVPGGVTVALSDGTNLYLAGQQLLADGNFTGYLSTLNLPTYKVTSQVGIADGTHTRMVFGDDDTLWVGASECANGERAANNQNVNCLTRIALGAAPAATIVPAVTPGGAATVPYPNNNNNLYYYGSLTGLCSVQSFHKVYTAYGGQIHAFNTADGSEINNVNITIQGTVLDVAYMDATDNAAN